MKLKSECHFFNNKFYAFSCYLLISLEKEMAAHSSILAWKIPWMEKSGRLQSMGLQRVGHNWATSLHFEHSLALPFFGLRMKTDLFQSCGHCWVFQICWHIECSTFTASSFRIWKSSTGIPSPLLALFIVILSKAHLEFTFQDVWL